MKFQSDICHIFCGSRTLFIRNFIAKKPLKIDIIELIGHIGQIQGQDHFKMCYFGSLGIYIQDIDEKNYFHCHPWTSNLSIIDLEN